MSSYGKRGQPLPCIACSHIARVDLFLKSGCNEKHMGQNPKPVLKPKRGERRKGNWIYWILNSKLIAGEFPKVQHCDCVSYICLLLNMRGGVLKSSDRSSLLKVRYWRHLLDDDITDSWMVWSSALNNIIENSWVQYWNWCGQYLNYLYYIPSHPEDDN